MASNLTERRSGFNGRGSRSGDVGELILFGLDPETSWTTLGFVVTSTKGPLGARVTIDTVVNLRA